MMFFRIAISTTTLLAILNDSIYASLAFSSPSSSRNHVTFRRRIHSSFFRSTVINGQASNNENGSDTDTIGLNVNKSNDFNQLKIAFVTGNAMKANEVNLILSEEQETKGPLPETSLVDLRIVNVDLPEIQEVNTEAIAKSKAILGAQLVGGPCVVEDTSLQFNALGGMVR